MAIPCILTVVTLLGGWFTNVLNCRDGYSFLSVHRSGYGHGGLTFC